MRALLWTQLIILVIITGLVLTFHDSGHLGDMTVYHNYARKILDGQMPYRDFNFEYPPLALIPIVIPELFNLTQELSSYTVLFFVEMVFCSWAITWGLYQLKPQMKVLNTYTVIVAVLGTLLPWRYDLFPAMLTLFSVIFLVKNRPWWCGVFLASGIAAKLYPLVILPVFFFYYLVSKQYSACLKFIVANCFTIAVTCLIFWTGAQEKLLSFLQYHRERGIQLESLPAGILLLASQWEWLKVDIIENFGALHLASPLAEQWAKVFPYIFLLFFILSTLFCWLSFRREYLLTKTISFNSLMVFINIQLLVFIVTNKVLSPQYLIWLIPFIPFLIPRYIYLFLIVSSLTMIIYPFEYVELVGRHTSTVMILNLRNFLLVFLLYYMSRQALVQGKNMAIERSLIKL